MNELRIDTLGDSALLLTFGEHIDAHLNNRIHEIADTLRAARLPGLMDIVPAYASIAVHYDLRAWQDGNSDELAGERVAQQLSAIVHKSPFTLAIEPMPWIDIPVCYEPEFAPDLAAVADHARLDTQEVVARHCGASYRVAMLGFAPGFPYLLGLDASLNTPRRAAPRTRVPAGSVAIGGAQTGIYPRELPGGWQIIGRTPQRLFNASKDPPALLAPGQQVRFRRIDADAFDRLQRESAG